MLKNLKYKLPGEYDEKQFLRKLADQYALKKEPAIAKRFSFFDTFDWRLFNKSLVLYGSGNKLFLRKLTKSEIIHTIEIASLPVFIWDFPDGQYGGNCNLVFCPNTNNYVIIAKGLHFLESSTVTGPYKLARKLIGQNTPRKWGFGGLSVYREGNESYLISSRHTKTVKPPLNRFFVIYKLNQTF